MPVLNSNTAYQTSGASDQYTSVIVLEGNLPRFCCLCGESLERRVECEDVMLFCPNGFDPMADERRGDCLLPPFCVLGGSPY